MVSSLVVQHPRWLTGRNRCCMKITLSWKSWDDWALMDVTPSRLLQADNMGHGRHREVSYHCLFNLDDSRFQEFSRL